MLVSTESNLYFVPITSNFSLRISVCDPKQQGIDQLLEKIYELYADFALKNPFYSLEMPIRADLFDQNIKIAIDQIERTGFI